MTSEAFAVELDGEALRLWREAEALYAEGSYQRALELYRRIASLGTDAGLDQETRDWIRLREAAATWRSLAAAPTADTSELDRARAVLEELATGGSISLRATLRAEALEELGDSWWQGARGNSGQAWDYYRQALDLWAGSEHLDRARRRYLDIVRKGSFAENESRPVSPRSRRVAAYQVPGNPPLDILDSALRIVETPEDRAMVQFLVALATRYQGPSPESAPRTGAAFEAVLNEGEDTGYYQDALWHYANWLADQGAWRIDQGGNWTREQQPERAVELLERLVRLSSQDPGGGAFGRVARDKLAEIRRPELQVGVWNVFVPGSRLSAVLNWRNVAGIELGLYQLDLEAIEMTGNGLDDALARLDPRSLTAVRKWTQEGATSPSLVRQNRQLLLDPVGPGAYLLSARSAANSEASPTGSGVLESRQLVVVSDLALVAKAGRGDLLFFTCSVDDGSPVPGATVDLWFQGSPRSGQAGSWQRVRSRSNGEGLVRFGQAGRRYQAIAVANGRPALLDGYLGERPRTEGGAWKIYAFTDRPAYRPGDEVRFKILARRASQGRLRTPSGESLEIHLSGPEGEEIHRETLSLNAFGSAWGSFELTESMRLGLYTARFSSPLAAGRDERLASADLFRLEEYKLPELTVAVTAEPKAGVSDATGRRSYRAGDTIPVRVEAQYLFGGPVRGAQAEILVYRSAYQVPPRPLEYSWLRQAPHAGRGIYPYQPPEELADRHLLALDHDGRATIEIETFAFAGQDSEYRVEARVTDSSRREVTGSGMVRVGRFPYYVDVDSGSRIYRPGDRAELSVTTVDVNREPVRARGVLTVFRRSFSQRWIDPAGVLLEGDGLARLRQSGRFPSDPARVGWRLVYEGYDEQEIDSTTLETDENGEAGYRIEIDRTGYYRAAWRGLEAAPGGEEPPVVGETSFFVGDATTRDLGYRYGGVEIVLGKESVRVGEKLPVLLTTRSPNRWVLMGIDSDIESGSGSGIDSSARGVAGLDSFRPVHILGYSHFLELEVSDSLAPKFFVDATLVSDRQLFSAVAEVLVPPVEHELEIEIAAEREEVRAGEQGALIVTTRDAEGNPVAAEVALSVADSAVLSIQKDLAPEPLAVFYGEQRWPRLQTQSSLQRRAYVFLDAGGDLDSGMELRDGEALGQAANAPPQAMRQMAASKSGAMAVSSEMALADSFDAGVESTVEVRQDFRATALWLPDLVTDAEGRATVEVDYPDSLTTWMVTARGASSADHFGQGSTETVTTLPFLVRLQAPRFAVEGDTAVVSAIVNNRSGHALEVATKLEIEGGARITEPLAGSENTVPVSDGDEARFEWRLDVESSGPLRLVVGAIGEAPSTSVDNSVSASADASARFSDGMERTISVYEHGLEKLIASSALLGDRADRAEITLDLPPARPGGLPSLIVQVSPSLATTMLDALPYLADYPYGCTEQTLSRFVPAAIVRKTLRDLGLDAETAMKTVYGGIEPGNPAAARRELAGAPSRTSGGSLVDLDDMITTGLERLDGMQNPDGGWPWFPGGSSDPFMTGYAVWSLALAEQAGVAVNASMLDRGVGFLFGRLPEMSANLELESWMVHAIATRAKSSGLERQAAGSGERSAILDRARDDLWQGRDRLSAYSRALLLWSEVALEEASQDSADRSAQRRDRIAVLARNLANGVQRGRAGTTVWWGETGGWWQWHQGAVETTAFVLRALLAFDPQHPLVLPASRFLIDNRRGAQWSNTRDTAIAVLALDDYLGQSGELDTDTEVELRWNGRAVARSRITPETILSAPRQFVLGRQGSGGEGTGGDVLSGRNRIEIVRLAGSGRIYLSAEARVMSAEEPITPASNKVAVSRELFEQRPKPTLLRGVRYEAVPVDSARSADGSLASGARLEAVITLEADHDLEYLMVEDLKAAGLEAVALQSGEPLFARELRADAILEPAAAATSDPGELPENVARGAASQIGLATQVRSATLARVPSNVEVRIAPAPRPGDDRFTGRQVWVYQELRDRKVALFVDRLPEGRWEIRYPLRVETPGRYHGLPPVAQAMYVPEIRGNGAEQVLAITDDTGR